MKNCIFCKIINKEIPGSIIYEDPLCIAFLDLSQTTKGHTLVIPKQHFKNILDVDEEVSAHLFKVVTKLAKQFTSTFDAKGVNILSNANAIAYQSVMHFHIHIIPRYSNNDFEIKFENNEGKYDLEELRQQLQ